MVVVCSNSNSTIHVWIRIFIDVWNTHPEVENLHRQTDIYLWLCIIFIGNANGFMVKFDISSDYIMKNAIRASTSIAPKSKQHPFLNDRLKKIIIITF